jgi:hypothetical protein
MVSAERRNLNSIAEACLLFILPPVEAMLDSVSPQKHSKSCRFTNLSLDRGFKITHQGAPYSTNLLRAGLVPRARGLILAVEGISLLLYVIDSSLMNK